MSLMSLQVLRERCPQLHLHPHSGALSHLSYTSSGSVFHLTQPEALEASYPARSQAPLAFRVSHDVDAWDSCSGQV